MSKVAHYLQEHLVGEVMTSTDARRYFATDGSILQLAPALIVYPRNENDVRKTARFSWQLAERGRVIPITPRGAGTNQSGAAVGNGIMLVFPAHMNRILEIDTKANTVAVEPGINYGKLQQTLFTHGRFLPPYPASLEYSTLGGAVANNTAGEKSVKYGATQNYVNSLRVVLANGEVIETRRLSKRELSKKLGLATFEGEIYRSTDTLIEEQHDLLERLPRLATLNNAGYNLNEVKRKDGSFDLTPLIVGSQGTLGIITEAVLATEPHTPQTTMFMVKFDSLEQTQNTVLELRELSEKPSLIELIDGNVLQQVYTLNPNQLKDVVPPPFPPTILLVEFDGNDKHQKKGAKKAQKIFEKYAIDTQIATDPDEQQAFWKVRQAVGSLIGHNEGLLRAVPLFDAAVTPDRLREYLEGVYAIFEANNLKPAVWGHAGDGLLHVQPRLNLGQIGDRQKVFRLLSEHTKLVLGMGGTISAEAGDGRLRTPYLEAMFGPELYALLGKVKNIFDPYGTLNPGVKFGTSLDDIKAMIRPDYSLDHLYDHLPRG
ncbi:MAG TPA: FAD-binding oxidoreductase [Candidatus Saccharimonadales bacterium]|jgi:FAD/FMN-containing dehydrogenase|nr:FAD-binding oxidoreductase [Candidatus Saccharimonadales bacterium]